MLERFKVILWDFDGVILNSNEIRDLGFEKVLQDFPKEKVDTLLTYHRKNGGLSRYHKFRYFYEQILGEKVSEERVQELALSFSKIMLELLTDKSLLIQDSLQFIRSYHVNYAMHIVSGSDQSELRFLAKQLEIESYFKSIYGSPTPKIQNVQRILEENEYAKQDVVLIGDSINDREAAHSNGIAFSAYNNPALQSDNYIYSFQSLYPIS